MRSDHARVPPDRAFKVALREYHILHLPILFSTNPGSLLDEGPPGWILPQTAGLTPPEPTALSTGKARPSTISISASRISSASFKGILGGRGAHSPCTMKKLLVSIRMGTVTGFSLRFSSYVSSSSSDQ